MIIIWKIQKGMKSKTQKWLYRECNSKYDMRSDTRYLRDTIINTRLADRIVFSVDRVNYEIYRRSPYYVGHKLWNNLDMDVQMSRTKSLFKSRIKLLN